MAGCPRAHWFGYYAEGEPEGPKARLLKQLVTPEMLAGQVVDWQVNRALDAHRAQAAEPDDLVERGIEAWKRLVASSGAQALRMRDGRPLARGAQPLLTDYYAHPADPQRLERCESRVSRALAGFLSSGVWAKVKAIPTSRWSPSRENWELRAEEWHRGGVRIWSAMDLWINYGAKGMVILDWKSGSAAGSSEALQLSTYSLWGQETRNLERQRVLVQAIHLPEAPEWSAKPISELECEVAREVIREDSEREVQLLTQTESSRGSAQFTADRMEFPSQPNPQTCLQCKFNELCPEGQTAISFQINTERQTKEDIPRTVLRTRTSDGV